MSAGTLTSRAIIGEYFATLESDPGNDWIGQISNYFQSDQESETYAWLGTSPQMREWIGGRQAKGLRENGMTIRNRKFEATLDIPVDDMRRDKTGQIMMQVRDLAERTNSHWAKLLSELLLLAETGLCYDGQPYFHTAHTEHGATAQDNDLTLNVGTPTAPTGGEMENAILDSVEAILGFKDDQGEPMNENAKSFLIMVPTPLMAPAGAAIGSQIIVDASTSRSNTLITLGNLNGFRINMVVNPRLTWTDKFAVFRADGQTKGLIRQEELAVTMSAQAEGSPIEFTDDKHQYGVKTNRAVGFGHWQRATLMTLT